MPLDFWSSDDLSDEEPDPESVPDLESEELQPSQTIGDVIFGVGLPRQIGLGLTGEVPLTSFASGEVLVRVYINDDPNDIVSSHYVSWDSADDLNSLLDKVMDIINRNANYEGLQEPDVKLGFLIANVHLD